jgi:branched-chain amino acid transport system substrate-binding protein
VRSRVYASLPLTGPSGAAGRDVLCGADLALERAAPAAVQLVVLDSSGADREARADANARTAASDPEAVAYLGDFHSSQVLRSAPVLAEAGLLAVAPVATFSELSGTTLVRLTPSDRVGAAAIAAWLTDAGVRELLVVHDHDAAYGTPVGAMCAEAARGRGIEVRVRRVWNHGEPVAPDLGTADALLYVGVAGSGAVDLWHELHGLRADLWLLGSDGVAAPWLAQRLSASAAARTRFFVARRAPLAFYGFEAMALVLDAIATAGADRAGVVRAARSTRDRDSALGRYSVDDDGRTTATAYGRLAVGDGELVWDR